MRIYVIKFNMHLVRMDNMTNKNCSTAYSDLNYASTDKLLSCKLVYSLSKVNSNQKKSVCTVLHCTNRLIAEAFLEIVLIHMVCVLKKKKLQKIV